MIQLNEGGREERGGESEEERDQDGVREGRRKESRTEALR